MHGSSIHFITPEGVKSFDADPAAGFDGAPPNFGRPLLPHVVTFQGVTGSASNVYRPSDEALKQSLDNARFMRNDLSVEECVEMRRRSTALLDWHLEVDDEDDPLQAGLRDELTEVLRQTPYFTKYRDALSLAIWFGKYAVENRFEWAEIHGRRRVVVGDWKPVHGDKLVYRYDDQTGQYDPKSVGIRVGLASAAGKTAAGWRTDHAEQIQPADFGMAMFLKPWQRDLLVIHKHQVEDGEYEEPQNAGRIHGVGIRSRIYWTWYQKQEALAWLMEFLERSALGFEIWYYPYGNDEAEQKTRKAATERAGLGRNIILFPRMADQPHLYGLDRIEPNMAGAEALKNILTEFFGHQVKRYILGQTLTTEASATGLGSNLATIHLATYLGIIKYDALNLQETLSRELVGPLKRFNFPRLQSIPVRLVIETDSQDAESRIAMFRQMWEMGARVRAKDVYDAAGAAQPAEDDEVLEKHGAGSVEGGLGLGGMPMPAIGRQPYRRRSRRVRYSADDGPKEGDRREYHGHPQVFHNSRWWSAETPPAEGSRQPGEPTHQDVASLVEHVVNTPRPSRGQERVWTSYRNIEAEESQRILSATGLDVTGYRHTVDDSAIRHVFARHGAGGSNLTADQLPVTAEDLQMLPQITAEPDAIEDGGATRHGLQGIIYKKRINGHLVVVEEVRTGRKELALVSMRKHRLGR